MAGVAEKARFYLERAVPQLREFEEKNIFTPDEIRSLVRKRTDFEHLVLSPGNKPTDWLNYVGWEKSLESLRVKRCRRLQVRTSSSHAGRGRIFSTLERAVSRHPESIELWKWLEERVSLDRVHSATASGRVLQGQEIQSKLVAEGMKERQIDEAIRTTEEKLSALKHAVKRERETNTKSPREEQT